MLFLRLKLVRYALFALCFALSGFTSRTVFGQGDDIEQARARYAEGQKQFELGNIDGALGAFTRSLESFPHFRTVFNIGLCHEKLGNIEAAIAMYQRYLDWPAEVPNQEEVSAKVADLQAKLPPEAPPKEPLPPEEPPAEESPEASEEGPPEEGPPEEGLPAGFNEDAEVRNVGQIDSVKFQHDEIKDKIMLSGWMMLGSGAAAAVAGSVFLGVAQARLRDMRDAEKTNTEYDPEIHGSLPREGERLQLAGWITGGVGLGVMAAGTTLVLLSRFKPEVFSRFAVHGALHERGANANFVLRF